MNEDTIPIDVPDDGQRIWRYMEFSKYVDLVTTCELHFARADQLEDPYDCSMMQFLGEQYRQLVLANPQGGGLAHQVNTFERLFVYVNCWHISDDESAALWRLYSENKYETIAIQTTVGKLKAETQDKWPRDGRIWISRVKYTPDAAGEHVHGGRQLSALGWEAVLCKRRPFVHEEELRAFILQGFDRQKEGLPQNESHVQEVMKARSPHIRIPVATPSLIEKVYISPHAKDWFVELVKRVSGGLKDRVVKSDLYELY